MEKLLPTKPPHPRSLRRSGGFLLLLGTYLPPSILSEIFQEEERRLANLSQQEMGDLSQF